MLEPAKPGCTCIHSLWDPCCLEGQRGECDGFRTVALSSAEVSMLRMGREFARLERMMGRFAEAFQRGFESSIEEGSGE